MSNPTSVHARFAVKTSVGWYVKNDECSDKAETARLYPTVRQANMAAKHIRTFHPKATIKVVAFQLFEI